MFRQARSESPKCPGHSSIELLSTTDGDDCRILTTVLQHHRKYLWIENECICVQQKHVIGINLFQRHIQGVAVGNVAWLWGERLAFNQVDPIE
ncbi:hypothetical protein D3C81_1826830 [compost metagenome]